MADNWTELRSMHAVSPELSEAQCTIPRQKEDDDETDDGHANDLLLLTAHTIDFLRLMILSVSQSTEIRAVQTAIGGL